MQRHLRSTGLSELASDTLSETLPSEALVFGKRRVCITGSERGIQRHFIDTCDLLIVTHGGHTLAEMRSLYRPKEIALHPSLHHSWRKELSSEAQNSGVKVIDMSGIREVTISNKAITREDISAR